MQTIGQFGGGSSLNKTFTTTRAIARKPLTVQELFDLKTSRGRANGFLLLIGMLSMALPFIANANQHDWWRDLVGFSPFSMD